jgi:hypothetical protein
VGEWDSQIASSSLGITLYNDTYTGANTCSAACDGATGSYPGANPGGGVRVESRDIKFEQKGKGKACPDLRREQACNTQKCPKDCVGGWKNDGAQYELFCEPSVLAYYQPQKYAISDNEIKPGTCANRGKTRNLLKKVEKKKKKNVSCRANCGYNITQLSHSKLTPQGKVNCPA